MAQTGSYEKRNGWWLLRYRESVVENGERKRVLRNRKLALLADFPPKRQRRKKGQESGAPESMNVGNGEGETLTAAPANSIEHFDDVPDAVKQLAREFLDSANDNRRQPEQVRKFGEFVENVYFPFAKQLSPATLKEYRGIWRRHLRPRVSQLWLRDVRTYDVNRWLQDIARQNPKLRTSSLQRVKSFISGIFTAAKNLGFFDAPNPVRDTDLPKAPKGKKTHAHTLEEIDLVFKALADEPLAATTIAVAAYAGLRRGEIRGLRWEEYNGVELQVIRSVWEGYVGEPKTDASAGTVPVIAALKKMLDDWRAKCGNPVEGWIFSSSVGTPIHLGNLINRNILPALKLAGLSWKGFHAFRRGLATNLHSLGVPAETIQLILRHSDVATTQRSYIKPPADEVRKAMNKLETRLTERAIEQALKKPGLLN